MSAAFLARGCALGCASGSPSSLLEILSSRRAGLVHSPPGGARGLPRNTPSTPLRSMSACPSSRRCTQALASSPTRRPCGQAHAHGILALLASSAGLGCLAGPSSRTGVKFLYQVRERCQACCFRFVEAEGHLPHSCWSTFNVCILAPLREARRSHAVRSSHCCLLLSLLRASFVSPNRSRPIQLLRGTL